MENYAAYGDKLYFSVYSDTPGKSGLYVVKGEEKPEMIYRRKDYVANPNPDIIETDYLGDLYILDESGVYITDAGCKLMYVSADGKTVEKIM